MDGRKIEIKVQLNHMSRCIDIQVVHSRVEPERSNSRYLPIDSNLPNRELHNSRRNYNDYQENICANNISNLVGSSSLLERTKSPFCTRNEPFELNESLPHRKSANLSLYETDKFDFLHNKNRAKIEQEDPYSHVEFKKIKFNKKALDQNDAELSDNSIKTISNSESEQVAVLSHLIETSEPSNDTDFQQSLHSESKEEKKDVESVLSTPVPKLDQEIQTESDNSDERSDLNQETSCNFSECDKEIQTVNESEDTENPDTEANKTLESEFKQLEIKKKEEPAKISCKPSETEESKSVSKPKPVEVRSPLLTKPRKNTDEEMKPRIQALKSLSSAKRLSNTRESTSKIPTTKTTSNQAIEKSKPLQFKCGKFDPKAMSKFEMSFQQKFKKST